MELVEGETLQARLRARGRLDLAETIRLLEQVASALDHAHANQVVHRDVKPANIMIEPSGQVKVMDFGIAKLETAANLTSTGLIMGTPNYMSPEQARGQKVDGRSDLFSLGCVLYECLTGTKPFQAESVSGILVKILTEEPPPVDFRAAGLPSGVGAVLSRAMAKEPAARYASGAEMIEALRAHASGAAGPATVTVHASLPALGEPAASVPGTLVSPPATPERSRRRLRRRGRARPARALAWLGWRRPAATPAGDPRSLVVEEDVGFLGRLLGRTPRVLFTLPAGTTFRLALEAPLSSESAVTGDVLSAETTSPVRIEGLEAVPAGSRLTGRVTHASSAAQSAGRGEMTLEFDTLELPGGVSDVGSRPAARPAGPGVEEEGQRAHHRALRGRLRGGRPDRGPQGRRGGNGRGRHRRGDDGHDDARAARSRSPHGLRSPSSSSSRSPSPGRSSRSGAREAILRDAVLRTLVLLLVSALPGRAEPPVLVRGVVRDPSGAPVAGARVTVDAPGGSVGDHLGGRHVLVRGRGRAAGFVVSAPGFAEVEGSWSATATEPLAVALRPARREEVTVTAGRTETRLGDTAERVVVLGRADIAASAALTLDDTLRQVPGFSLFRRSGSRVANPTSQGASLRGVGPSGASRTLVLLDGVPLNDAFGGWVYWSRVPRAAIERVEVLEGGASDLYGSAALGGVVQALGRSDDGAVAFDASLGNEDTAAGSVFVAGRSGGLERARGR